MSLSRDDVTELVRLFAGSPYSEFRLDLDGFRLRFSKSGESSLQAAPPPVVARAAPAAAPAPGPQPAPATANELAPPGPGEIDVPAPLLGTFYHAPRPGDAPFVTVGQVISKDTVFGIIEVMKLMNPVHVEAAGTVIALLAPNATSVEAGQPLLRLKVA